MSGLILFAGRRQKSETSAICDRSSWGELRALAIDGQRPPNPVASLDGGKCKLRNWAEMPFNGADLF